MHSKQLSCLRERQGLILAIVFYSHTFFEFLNIGILNMATAAAALGHMTYLLRSDNKIEMERNSKNR